MTVSPSRGVFDACYTPNHSHEQRPHGTVLRHRSQPEHATGKGMRRRARPRPTIMSENVTLVRSGSIATVTLNRPDRRNSLSDAMLTELGAAFAELRDDATTRVVIVTGAPPVFSAGADAPHARGKTDEERRRRFLLRKSTFRSILVRSNPL